MNLSSRGESYQSYSTQKSNEKHNHQKRNSNHTIEVDLENAFDGHSMSPAEESCCLMIVRN